MPLYTIGRASAVAALLALAPAVLAMQRTFVSTGGNDANACSLAAPCRSFTAALAKTAVDGEVVVLDSGGYGAVMVTQGVTIQSPAGIYAGLSVFSGNGIDVNAPGANVVLRGLVVNGQGGSTGINLIDAANLHIEDCVVSNLGAAGIVLGGSGDVFIANTVVRNNASDGITLSGPVTAVIDNTRVERNAGAGVDFAGGATATIARSTIARNALGGIAEFVGSTVAVLNLHDSVVASNGGTGVIAGATGAGAAAHAYIVRSTISSNSAFGAAAENFAGALAFMTILESEVNDNGSDGVLTGGDSGTTLSVAGTTVVRNATAGFRQQTTTLFLSRRDNVVHNNPGGDAVGTITALPAH